MMMNQEDDRCTMLPRIFQDDIPKLKNLTLGNVSAWPHNRFFNLTRFRLHRQPPGARATLPEFLEFLAASPKLEELVLVCAGPAPNDDDDDDDVSPHVVALPCLQYLEIGWPDQWRVKDRHLQMFLKHLSIPSTATRCFFEGGPNPLIDYHLMQEGYKHLKQMVDVTKKIVMTSYYINDGYESFIGLNDSTLYCNYTNDNPSLTPFSTTMLWENVEELIYVPWSTWRPLNLISLLGQLPSLRRLTISGSMWRSTGLEELSGALRELELERKRFKYAPLLEELHVCPMEEGWREETEQGANCIMMICNVRANNGRTVKKVVLDHFRDESIEMLKDYFDEVEDLGERERRFSVDDTFGYWRSYDHFQIYVQ
jgi:hypothetical protein